MGAVIGRREVMDAAQKTFISSTYWTERLGPTAALATLKKHRRLDVGSHLVRAGTLVQEGWKAAAKSTGLNITVVGIPPVTNFVMHHDHTLALQTLYVQEMLRRGFLACDRFYPTLAHTEKEIEGYLHATKQAFAVLVEAIASGNPEKFLEGPVKMSGFTRLN